MTKESKERSLRFLRFGLTAVVAVALIVALGVFLASTAAPVLSLIASLVIFSLTLVLALIVYYGYKMILDRMGQGQP